MTNNLTALADALLEGGCGESCDALCAKAGNVLRTLAAADAGMPLAAVHDESDDMLMFPGFLTPESEAKMRRLVYEADAQAAALVAYEAGKAAAHNNPPIQTATSVVDYAAIKAVPFSLTGETLAQETHHD